MRDEEPIKVPISEDQKILESAKIWFGTQDEFQIPNALGISSKGRIQTKKIKWENAIVHAGGKIIEVQVDYNFHAVPTRGEKSESKLAQKQKDAFYRLILISDGDGGYKKSILKFFPEVSISKQKSFTENSFLVLSSDFSGSVRLFTWNEQFLKGWNVTDGKVVKYITPIIEEGGKRKSNGYNLNQNGCSNYIEVECMYIEEDNFFGCFEIPVVECDQEQNYDESPEGGGYGSPTWSQNNWHGYWPGFGFSSAVSEQADLQSKISLDFELEYRNRMAATELLLFDNLSRLKQLRYLNNASTAISLAEYLYPENTLIGGCGDAFRHSYFSGLNVGSLGFETAKALGDAHEVNPGNQTNDRLMDLYNNELGRNLAWSLLSRGYQSTLQRELWISLVIQGHNGRFKIIQYGNLMFGEC